MKTGVTSVRSGRCVPPAHGSFRAIESPGLKPEGASRGAASIAARTERGVDPR